MPHPKVGVEWFSGEMRRKLDENSHKRGWDVAGLRYCLERMIEEVIELEPLVDEAGESDYTTKQADEIIGECADVANFAMMMAWRVAPFRTDQVPPSKD